MLLGPFHAMVSTRRTMRWLYITPAEDRQRGDSEA
jgi:hypothetical protein